MAAGLGFKNFQTGEVLTSADVNGYLMQGVLVFASEAARDAAITSPQEGQFAYTKDNNSLWYYTGSAWAASGATGDIEGVTAGTGISGGGTSGTVTITNSMATAIDAKGDLVVGTGADTFSRLGVGANNTVLTADSAEATGLKWAAPSASSGPAFRAFRNTSVQTITGNTWTKVELNAETFDTASCFDSTTNYRFTPNVAGYYSLQAALGAEAQTTSTVYAQCAIYKNGAVAALGTRLPAFADDTQGVVHDIIYLNGTTDYVELYGFVVAGTVNENFINGTTKTFFTGVWIRS
jgi:hypothetical protein